MAEDQENRATHNSPVIVRVDPSALESSWVPNKDSATCQLCFKGFTLFDRRHHCRACGALVCQACSKRRVFDRTKDHQVRVCSKCFADLRVRAMREAVRPESPVRASLTRPFPAPLSPALPASASASSNGCAADRPALPSYALQRGHLARKCSGSSRCSVSVAWASRRW